ncbi:MAG: 2-oxoacid:acceptor oxidoreductase subunit alpha [Nitrospirota bacterium]|nr:2-oxoacid:acceptor oxidoreductase subunit alpha [Nitrospirota bacterium]
MDYSIKIGGEAGQGIQTIGETLGRVFARTGLHVFTNQDYESRVRGGHNFYQIRLSDRPVRAPRAEMDIVVALDRESIAQHARELTDRGQIIYDAESLKEKHDQPSFLDVPFAKLAMEHGGSRIMANTVATGAVLGMLGMDLDVLLGLIDETFRKKGEPVIKANRSAALAGYDHAVKSCLRCNFAVPAGGTPDPLMLVGGTEAIALGALASGVKFYAAYPMTPSTGIMNYLASKEKEFGLVVEQAEDEIAAVNMAVGASFAGARSMTGTSGGGFALMVEGVSLAAITETPIVIALGQRPGPATGLPTRTEQGELHMTLHAGHGEFPRFIFAPGSPEQAFFLTNKAFDLAEKYQVPAFVLFDTSLSDSQWTYQGFDLARLRNTDYRLRGEAFAKLARYQRFQYTESGVTPLAVPGDGPHLVVADSDEHDEDGHLTEDAATRIRMTEKRIFNKLPAMREEISPPFLYGDHKPDIVLVCWGSLYGLVREAVDALAENYGIAMLHFSEIHPFPSTERFDYLEFLGNARLALCVEQNATGQFARLMRTETGFEFSDHVLRYDGRPFMVEDLVAELKMKISRI